MLQKTFKFDEREITVKELTLGQMRKLRDMNEENAIEDTINLIKEASGTTDEVLNEFHMSEIYEIADWLGNPTA